MNNLPVSSYFPENESIPCGEPNSLSRPAVHGSEAVRSIKDPKASIRNKPTVFAVNESRQIQFGLKIIF